MLHKDIRKGASAGTAAPDEIVRFNALADEWWKPDGAFKVMHRFNVARVAHLSQRLPALLGCDTGAQPLRGRKILDVGCAAGLVTEPLSRLGADILGIDAAERNILVAQRHAAATGANIQYRHALPEDIADQAGHYDVVMSLEVIEHVADLPRFLAEIAALVKPGGILAIGTINRTARSFIKAIVGAEYVLRWLPRGTHNWRKFVTPAELAGRLDAMGFVTEERAGIVPRLMTMQWHVSDDCSATYLQFHRKIVPVA